MRIDVPQFSLEVPEGWGTPLLAVAGALVYGLGWAVATGLVHRTPVRRRILSPGPIDRVDVFLGAFWPALVAGEGLQFVARQVWRVVRVPVRPFAALARRVAGDTCPRT
jgi:hypothetical protein